MRCAHIFGLDCPRCRADRKIPPPQVGYSVRFEALCTPDTKVLYLTDGMLFREILLDPLLSR